MTHTAQLLKNITCIEKYKRYSLHQITDRNDIPFSMIEYSKFKFGDKTIAKKFGFDLASGFINDFVKKVTDFAHGKQIVVCSSPYNFIPTATFAMKDYFIQKLNSYLACKHLPIIQEAKIHRTNTYTEDYGGLTAEKRMELIGQDGFHIDKSFIEGKTVIFMDDIRITGSHEKVITRMVNQYGLSNEMVFMYFAELCSDEIHPAIENDFNYAAVKNLLDLDKIIKNENFLLNTRTVKYILNSEHEDFVTFIQYQSKKLVQNIWHQSIGNNYHNIEKYRYNLYYILEMLGDDL